MFRQIKKIQMVIIMLLAVIVVVIAAIAKSNEIQLKLDFCTYLGGSNDDRAHGTTLDDKGNVYLTAPIHSTDFPTTPGALYTNPNGIYVAKMNSSGDSLIFSTYLGASGGANYAHGIAIDKHGCIYIAGNTTNPEFPTTKGAFDEHFKGPVDKPHGDAFVVKLNPEGDSIIYSTFIGGTDMDLCGKIAVDDNSNVYLLGTTSSTDFPVTSGAFDTTFNGGGGAGRDDLFAAKLNADGNKLIYCTYIGGSKTEIFGNNFMIDDSGCVYITGTTSSEDFPTTSNSYDSTYNGGSGFHGNGDAFIVQLNPSGSALLYSSFLGGSGDDCARDIRFDNRGKLYLSGWTKSVDFPTTKNAYSKTMKSEQDAFFARMNLKNGHLEYASFFGGNQDDEASIAVDNRGRIYLVGNTQSTDLPVTSNPYDEKHHGKRDIFIAIFNSSKNLLKYCTYFGGDGDEIADIRIANDGSLYLTGNTTSNNLPTTQDAYDKTYNGGGTMPWGGDVFVVRFLLFGSE